MSVSPAGMVVACRVRQARSESTRNHQDVEPVTVNAVNRPVSENQWVQGQNRVEAYGGEYRVQTVVKAATAWCSCKRVSVRRCHAPGGTERNVRRCRKKQVRQKKNAEPGSAGQRQHKPHEPRKPGKGRSAACRCFGGRVRGYAGEGTSM